ncbi:MAG: hypothetical protein H7233_02690, partial [Pseudorhodobacter sp.]|nr:hypothetical protein [Frankiaceae bacterium]
MTAALTAGELAAVRQVLAAAAGLVFDDSRIASLAWSARERCHRTGAGDVADYLAQLAQPAEVQQLLDEVTIQETHF